MGASPTPLEVPVLLTASPDVAAAVRRARAPELLTLAQDLVLALAPQGGQGRSRRNAWQGMSREAATAAARLESAVALQQAVLRAGATARPTSAAVGP